MVESVSGKGEVYSYTTIYGHAPSGFENQVPYVIALIKIPEKDTPITAQLTDLTWHKEIWMIDDEKREVDVPDIEIGTKVEMVTRKLREDGDSGIIIYGYKFRPPIISSETSQEEEFSTSSK